MTCKGDTILLPAGHKYNRLYLLAASTDGDYVGTFRCGRNKTDLVVPSYTGFIGQWGHTGHTKGYLKDAEIAHVGTHRHAPDGDQVYEFTYMFKFGIDVPEGATSLILPDNDKIVLFAATLVQEGNRPATAACELFRTAIKGNAASAQSMQTIGAKENLLKDAKVIAYSGYTNDREKPEFMLDGNMETKWCDVSSTPNYVDFDLGEAKNISGWKLVNAGQESHAYITNGCFLQGKNSLNEEWKTLDSIDGNTRNVVSREIGETPKIRYIRLLITRPTQSTGGKDTRIYEFEVYQD